MPKAADHIDVPFFSADGRRLYFMTGTRNAQGIVEKEAIWFVEKTEGGWAEPKPFDPSSIPAACTGNSR